MGEECVRVRRCPFLRNHAGAGDETGYLLEHKQTPLPQKTDCVCTCETLPPLGCNLPPPTTVESSGDRVQSLQACSDVFHID